jgi:hypothetical protein
MTSKTATILAVALLFGICLIILLLIAVILGLRLVRYRRSHGRDSENLKAQIQARQEKLDKFDTMLGLHNGEDCRASCATQVALMASYKHIFRPSSPLEQYVSTSFSQDKIQSPIPVEDHRLSRALFKAPKSDLPIAIDRDLSLFSNPQKYTTEEIAALLQSAERRLMVQHIIVSTLLKNTSIKGNPTRTLLPLMPNDIDSLYNLSHAVQNGLQRISHPQSHLRIFAN